MTKFLGMLGLCRGAGQVIVGVPMICERLTNKGKPSDGNFIIIEASDTSANTHKKISDKSKFYDVKHVKVDVTCLELGRAVGKSSVAAVAVFNKNMCIAIEKQLAQMDNSKFL